MSVEFYDGDDEFDELKVLAIDWCKANKLTSFSNYDHGEACAQQFEIYVKEKFPAVAKRVQADEMVYQAVLEFLNESGELDSSDDE